MKRLEKKEKGVPKRPTKGGWTDRVKGVAG